MNISNHVMIIGDWEDEKSSSIRIQNFEKDGSSFIPIFSSKESFERLVKGSIFLEKGVSIDLEMLLSMLKGDERLVLNPGSNNPWVLTAQYNSGLTGSVQD